MSDLDKLLYWRGIASEFYNYRGELTPIPYEHRLNLLRAMGDDPDDGEAVAEEVYHLDVQPWLLRLPKLSVVPVDNPGFAINVVVDELEQSFTWCVTLETGEDITGVCHPNTLPEVGNYLFEDRYYSRRRQILPQLPMGYHSIQVSRGDQCEQAQLVVVPTSCYRGSWVEQEEKLWGFIVQLYTLRSSRNWGIGDFTDLKDLAILAAKAGVDIVGLNPLHALSADLASNISPYSPSDRRFLSPLYIDPEVEPDFTSSAGLQEQWSTIQSELKVLREATEVQYQSVKQSKYAVFEQMYRQFLQFEDCHHTERAGHFRDFIAAEGWALQQFAAYEVLRNRWDSQYLSFPEQLEGDPSEQLSRIGIKDIAKQHPWLMGFHCYLQWLASGQLHRCQEMAEQAGMKIGIMRDLAVGADGYGAEVSANADIFCRQASVGAPPDPMAELGQNWGLPPMDPVSLRESNHQHFLTLLRSNMQYCGALRIDHAMALLRLWWCPPGDTADHGAYVYYPLEDLLGLLCLESHRNQCAVIGEDMGVVPPELRTAIIKAGIFTNNLFYFEKDHQQNFKSLEEYPVQSLAMVTNHDVPTLAGWWLGEDLALRRDLDLFQQDYTYEQGLQERVAEKRKLLDWLRVNGAIDDYCTDEVIAQPLSEELVHAILKTCAACAAQLFVLQLEDILRIVEPVNVPGTSREYPNWQRKLTCNLDEIFHNQSVAKLFRDIQKTRNVSG